MMHDPLAWIGEELAALEAQGLRRRLATREGPQSPDAIRLDGELLANFGSNDYLGLAAERLQDAAARGLESAGWGSAASPLVTGRATPHAELETALAEFEQTEAALLFSSGYAANAGVVAALAGPDDVILSDAGNHASIIDGCRLSRARVVVYAHADVDDLARALQQSQSYRRRLIVTDSLFSMEGDLAPLGPLSELAERYDAMLMVDEAHATGVFGGHGRGVAEHFGVEDGVHVRVGTLSKALGSAGGFVAGARQLIDWLANRARSYVFSTAPPACVASAGLESLRIVRDEPARRVELLDRAARLRERLRGLGWRLGESQSQIIPLVIGDPRAAMEAAAALRRRGVFAPGIRPPTVPQGRSLVRISLCWPHTQETIDRLVSALADLR